MEDSEAWVAYPHMSLWFNKLYLAQRLEYMCGPGGVAPTVSDYYCVRPIYNVGGMGVGARKQWIDAGDTTGVEPGYFWCEWFDGDQYSVTYEITDHEVFNQISCFLAERDTDNLYRFKRWTKSSKQFPILPLFRSAFTHSGLSVVNIEMIGDKVIETHFRDSPDPDYDELIPIWSDATYMVDIYTKIGYNFIEAIDDSNGYLKTYRIGFMIK